MEAFPKGISVINEAVYSPAGFWEYAMPAYNNPTNITAIDGELELFVHGFLLMVPLHFGMMHGMVFFFGGIKI